MFSEQNKIKLAYSLIIVWLVGTGCAFYWFQNQDQRLFQPPQASFKEIAFANPLKSLQQSNVASNQPEIADIMEQSRAVVFHFWQPGCSCNRFNAPHVKTMVKEYKQHNIHFVIVVPKTTHNALQELKKTAFKKFGTDRVIIDTQNIFSPVTAAPAALVMTQTKQHKTAHYFGAYSFSALCNPGDGSYVETSLNNILQNKPSLNPESTNGKGCFCHWGNPENSLAATSILSASKTLAVN